jgi:hypothetical protein
VVELSAYEEHALALKKKQFDSGNHSQLSDQTGKHKTLLSKNSSPGISSGIASSKPKRPNKQQINLASAVGVLKGERESERECRSTFHPDFVDTFTSIRSGGDGKSKRKSRAGVKAKVNSTTAKLFTCESDVATMPLNSPLSSAGRNFSNNNVNNSCNNTIINSKAVESKNTDESHSTRFKTNNKSFSKFGTSGNIVFHLAFHYLFALKIQEVMNRK